MKRKINLALLAITILAVIASSSLSTGAVNAQEFATDPDTTVSNIAGVLPLPLESSATSSAPYAGDGKLAESGVTIPKEYLSLPPLDGGLPESVIGVDGRRRQNPTTTFPNRAIAHLVVTFPSGSGTCTGWFIGRRTVATAGHCVYDINTDQWATSIKIFPARNGTIAPYGSTTAYRLFSVSGWTSRHDSAFDYAAIQTNAPLGDNVGWFGFRWQQSKVYPGNFKINGYPGDKRAGTQWFMSGPITQANTYRLWYNIDTYGGQSGSPLYHQWTGDGCTKKCYYGVGIHTYGTSLSPYFGNSATRIRKVVFDNLKAWNAASYP